MGAVAQGVLDHGGQAIGVLPSFLQTKEIAHSQLTELIIVENMHERKTKMSELCDGVITLPGGFGTLEELFEMLTWAQLGLHQKPIGLLNIDNYYSPLLKMVRSMTDSGFLKTVNRDMLLHSENLTELMEQMHTYQAPDVPKWMHKGET